MLNCIWDLYKITTCTLHIQLHSSFFLTWNSTIPPIPKQPHIPATLYINKYHQTASPLGLISINQCQLGTSVGETKCDTSHSILSKCHINMLQGQDIYFGCISVPNRILSQLCVSVKFLPRWKSGLFFTPNSTTNVSLGLWGQCRFWLCAQGYLSLCHCLSVDDGDNPRHQGTPAEVAVSQNFLLGGPRRQRPRELCHHLPHHRQPSLYCLQKEKKKKH